MHASHHHVAPPQTGTRRHRAGERGASLVEYALLVALIAVVCIGAATFLGVNTSGTITKGGNGISGHNVQAHCGQGSGNGMTSHQFSDENGVIDPNQYPGPCPGGAGNY